MSTRTVSSRPAQAVPMRNWADRRSPAPTPAPWRLLGRLWLGKPLGRGLHGQGLMRPAGVVPGHPGVHRGLRLGQIIEHAAGEQLGLDGLVEPLDLAGRGRRADLGEPLDDPRHRQPVAHDLHDRFIALLDHAALPQHRLGLRPVADEAGNPTEPGTRRQPSAEPDAHHPEPLEAMSRDTGTHHLTPTRKASPELAQAMPSGTASPCVSSSRASGRAVSSPRW
jgi:hypothetical protein